MTETNSVDRPVCSNPRDPEEPPQGVPLMIDGYWRMFPSPYRVRIDKIGRLCGGHDRREQHIEKCVGFAWIQRRKDGSLENHRMIPKYEITTHRRKLDLTYTPQEWRQRNKRRADEAGEAKEARAKKKAERLDREAKEWEEEQLQHAEWLKQHRAWLEQQRAEVQRRRAARPDDDEDAPGATSQVDDPSVEPTEVADSQAEDMPAATTQAESTDSRDVPVSSVEEDDRHVAARTEGKKG